jgi:RHS repeat-associated protein
LEEHDGDGRIIARYVYGLGLISREDANGALSIYHFDSRGSTVALTDVSGTVTDRYAYSPFGSIVARQGDTPNPFTYVGRFGVVDDGNGFYYMRNRYYAPALMRFLQKDAVFYGSLLTPQTLNRYAYAEGNPVLRIDPNGDFPFLAIAIGFAVGAVCGVGGQVISDAIDGDWGGWEDYVGAALGGAIGGALGGGLSTLGSSVLAAGLSAAAGNGVASSADYLLTAAFSGATVDTDMLFLSMGIGAVVGGATGAFGSFLTQGLNISSQTTSDLLEILLGNEPAIAIFGATEGITNVITNQMNAQADIPMFVIVKQ